MCIASIKLETANPVRSFKARRAEVVASLLADNGSRTVVCASAGSLGQALAWSCHGRGIDVTVVASRFTPAVKLDRIRALNARLELVDGDFDMARERASAVARGEGIRLVEDRLDIETCERAATIGLELWTRHRLGRRRSRPTRDVTIARYKTAITNHQSSGCSPGRSLELGVGSETLKDSVYGQLEIAPDAFATVRGGFGERDSGVSDHAGQNVGHRGGGGVGGKDSGLDPL